jgi:hypothetical protein
MPSDTREYLHCKRLNVGATAVPKESYQRRVGATQGMERQEGVTANGGSICRDTLSTASKVMARRHT